MQIRWLELHRYPAVTMGLVQILAIWLVASLGWLELPNLLLYDRFLAYGFAANRPSHVLLIEIDAQTPANNPAALPTLLRRLHELGARRIGLEFPPQEGALLALAGAQGNVVFARGLATDAADPGRRFPKPLPPTLEHAGIAYGYAEPPLQRHGTYRGHRLWLDVDGQRQPSFLAKVADLGAGLPDAAVFYPDLDRESVARLPKLGIEQALAGGLIEELVRGRSILIAPSHENLPPLHTPVGPMSSAMFDAVTLNALIDGHGIRFAGTGALLAGIAAIIGANLFLAQLIPLQGALWGGLGLCFAYMAAVWLALHGFGLWLPLTEYLLAQVWVFFALFRQRALVEQRSLHSLATRLRFEIRKQVMPAGFYQTDDHWTYVAVLVQQIFDLKRVIFLERIQGDHRLREIKALNCSLDSIDEKRRDYERTPYSTAIAEFGPIELERSFFRNADPLEIQYLAPMLYAGDVLGFWAISFAPGGTQRDSGFLSRLRDFSEQLGYLLHARREWQERRKHEEEILGSFLRIQAGESAFRDVNRAAATLEKKLSQVRTVINELGIHCIVYDLFGRVAFINHNMEKLARQEKLLPYDVTMADFTAELTGYSIAHVRSLMQSIIFMGSTFTLPVSLAENRYFILNLKPLKAAPEEVEMAPELAEARPFQLQGVLFEMIEITMLVQQCRAQDELLRHILEQLRNSLTSLLLAADLLEQDQIEATETRTLAALLQERLRTVAPTLDQLQARLHMDFHTLMDHASAVFPMDGIKPLEAAVANLAEATRRFDVTARIARPSATRLILASAGELREVYDCILAALVADSISNGVISIEITNEPRHVRLAFKNQGFGLPVEQLRAYVEGEEAVAPRPFAGLREASAKVRRWGGELSLDSRLAAGIEVTLVLDAFL